MRILCALLAAAALLTACASGSSGGSDPNSYFRCDRNGEREQRAACQ